MEFYCIMSFSSAELKLVREVARGATTPANVARALNRTLSQIYRILRNLEKKDVLELNKGTIKLNNHVHIQQLAILLSQEKSIISKIAGTGLDILICIKEIPKTVSQISQDTSLTKSTIFYKLNQFLKINLVKKDKTNYCINKKIWSDMKTFIESYCAYQQTIDKRIPLGSIIYYKNLREIVFSYKSEFNAAKTGFSAFSKYGVKLYTITNTYYLPKKELSVQEVFRHSLYVVEKEMKQQQLIIIAIFYLKHETKLKKINHFIVDSLTEVIQGKNVKGMPLKNEIIARAKMYDVNVEKYL